MATKGDGTFQFISIENPAGVSDRKTRRLARSHAVKVALENKRKAQQQSGNNFRVTTLKQVPNASIRKIRRKEPTLLSPSPLTPVTLDPFQILVADSSRLQSWLIHHKARKATEPIFSIADELVLRNFRSVFQTSLDDPALLNATMLTFAFAVTGAIDQECLAYHGQALNNIRERISSPTRAASESTLGAILLLAGIEARMSMPFQVQLHMNAIQHLLKLCQTRGVHLTDSIKRAIFWQDLNSSVMTGSSRIVDHVTFTELHWKRDHFIPNAFVLPPGFQRRSHLFTDAFIEVLEDIHALQCIREIPYFGHHDQLPIAQIDNHQASIQSRLFLLADTSPFMECCRLGAYLCSATLRCKIWPDSVIPSHLSLQLLHRLQPIIKDPVWNGHLDLLIWLLHMGGAFASTDAIRFEYSALLRCNYNSRFAGLYESWPELFGILTHFIWSNNAFLSRVQAFWQEFSQ